MITEATIKRALAMTSEQFSNAIETGNLELQDDAIELAAIKEYLNWNAELCGVENNCAVYSVHVPCCGYCSIIVDINNNILRVEW